jgi:hypothetical protein
MTKLKNILYPIHIKQINYHGWDHLKISAKYSGDLEYLNDFIIYNRPISVYKCRNPDRSKGHKDYFLIENFGNNHGGQVMGMDQHELEKYSIINGLLCTNCNTAIYNVTERHLEECDCQQSSVTGTQDTIRINYNPKSTQVKMVRINLITKEVI